MLEQSNENLSKCPNCDKDIEDLNKYNKDQHVKAFFGLNVHSL